jgi:hypothetical protein
MPSFPYPLKSARIPIGDGSLTWNRAYDNFCKQAFTLIEAESVSGSTTPLANDAAQGRDVPGTVVPKSLHRGDGESSRESAVFAKIDLVGDLRDTEL